jgi:hypothetical protein
MTVGAGRAYTCPSGDVRRREDHGTMLTAIQRTLVQACADEAIRVDVEPTRIDGSDRYYVWLVDPVTTHEYAVAHADNQIGATLAASNLQRKVENIIRAAIDELGEVTA